MGVTRTWSLLGIGGDILRRGRGIAGASQLNRMNEWTVKGSLPLEAFQTEWHPHIHPKQCGTLVSNPQPAYSLGPHFCQRTIKKLSSSKTPQK